MRLTKRRIQVIRPIINFILCIVLFCSGIAERTVSGEEVTKQVLVSEWNAHLDDHRDLVTLYYGLLDAVNEDGERLYSDEFIIGFLANVESEGNTGVVEYAFSREGAYEFALPSGSTKIRTLSDINYLLDWTISDEGTVEGGTKKGRCGVSCVQWSYGRRIQYLERLKRNTAGRYEITTYDIAVTDLEMVLYELTPGKRYYNEVMEAVGDSKDVRVYAEAFCDRYFKPKKADLKMSGTGDACVARRKLAGDLWKLFKSEEMVYKDITFSF